MIDSISRSQSLFSGASGTTSAGAAEIGAASTG